MEDTIEVVKNLENKTPGNDKLVVELFKYGGGVLMRKLYILLRSIWLTEKMPGMKQCCYLYIKRRTGLNCIIIGL